MHAPTPQQKWYQKFSRSGYFLVALLLHLVAFFLVATLIIWPAPKPPANSEFQAVAVKTPPPPVQPPSQGTSANNPQFEPTPVSVPVATPLSAISSNKNNSFTIDTSKVLVQALSHVSDEMAQGAGMGAGAGSGITGLGSSYGSTAGPSDEFVGAFYDMKQTPDGKPTDGAENDFEKSVTEDTLDPNWITAQVGQNNLKVLRNFAKTWDMSILDNYYKAPDSIFAGQIAVPMSVSTDATKAFHINGKVRARRWIIIYTAKFSPPESGRYRFIGFADDFLLVRVNGENVLDASLSAEHAEVLDPSASTGEDVGMGPESCPLRCGNWIDMQAGLSMTMQVLVGEGPGGYSGFLLMVQKEGDNSPKGDYPVFQLKDMAVPEIGNDFHYSKKKLLFQGVR